MYFNRLLTDYQEGTGSFLSIQSMMIRSVTRRQTRRHFVRNSINRQGRRRAYKRKVRACWRRLYCREIVISITYSECVFVALGIQHAKRICCIILSSVACLPPLYFSTLPHRRHDFWGKKLSSTKCVFWFYQPILSETFLILIRTEWGIVINVHRSSCTVPLFLSDFNLLAPELFFLILAHSIQGVTGGMCETSGECFLGQTIPI